jgi:dimethylaniline monooxygenase (N-oxide forming)
VYTYYYQFQSHTLIIDTPGIGSSPELTSRLLDYLPNALAFIYVINSSNAGGLQGDRVDILSFCFVSHF